MLALVTAIVGSAAGANLFLILLDIAEGRPGRRSARPRAAEESGGVRTVTGEGVLR
jgi:hypothetical protein